MGMRCAAASDRGRARGRGRVRSRFDQLADGRLYERLGARWNAELPARIVEMKFHRATAQAQNLANLGERLAARSPGQRFALALAKVDEFRPQRAARNTLEPRSYHCREHVKVHRLGHIVVGAKLPALELAVVVR